MTNSREKFEAWMSDDGEWPKAIERDQHGGYKLMQAQSAWMAWQPAYKAGRESMRDEAALEATDGIWFDKTGSEIADSIAQAIKEIQP